MFDFVARAFEGVVEKFRVACHNNVIANNDPYLSIPKAVRAFEDPVLSYNGYLERLMRTYIEDYLISANNKQNVLDVKQFFENFIIYMSYRNEPAPITFTSWQRSKKSSIFTSGIAIDIAGFDIDDDESKETFFLNNPVLPFFLNVCTSEGFNVSHNAPYILVADIMSPALQQRCFQYGLVEAEGVFQHRYDYAYMRDVELLKQQVYENFNFFVQTAPVEKYVYMNCNNKTYSGFSRRYTLNPQQFDSYINDKYLLPFYIDIRNQEEDGVLSSSEITKIKNYGKTFFSLDSEKTMRYINEEYRNTYKSKDGGLNYMIRKTKQQVTKSGTRPPTVGSTTRQDDFNTRELIESTQATSQTTTGGSGGGGGSSSGGY